MNRTLLTAAALAIFTVAFAEDPLRELRGLENVHKASGSIYLGGEPQGETGFASLQKLGITTVVSVDGATPDVTTAKKIGIRIIHIPIGYDGIPDDAARALTRVAREVEGPLYVHCHHGKHRGPAACAVICIARGSLTHEQATALMISAGTDKNYTGLWRDVNSFAPSEQDAVLPELVEIADVKSIAAAMAEIDRSFEKLKLYSLADGKPSAGNPEIVPAAEALLVSQGLRECRRQLTKDDDAQFHRWISESSALAQELCDAAKAGDAAVTQMKLQALERKCVRCHAEYRNK